MKWEDTEIQIFERKCEKLVEDIEHQEVISLETHVIETENMKLLQDIENLRKENSVLKSHLVNEQQLNEKLKNNLNGLQENVARYELSHLALESDTKIKESDELRLKKAKEMFNLGKDFTGIRWDYSSPANICRGYIANKDKKNFDTFEYDRDKIPEEKIQEHLWNKMEAQSSAQWDDLVSMCKKSNGILEDKENVQRN